MTGLQMGWMAPAPTGVTMRHSAVVTNHPEEEPPNAVEQGLPRIRGLKGIDRFDVLKHEWQVEDTELPGEFLELRQRWSGKVYVALKQCL